MKKTHKAGELFNKFQAKKSKHKKSYSESDSGSMAGYDPTGGLGNKGYAKATAVPKQAIGKAVSKIAKPATKGSSPYDSSHSVQAGKGAYNANSTRMNTAALGGVNTTKLKSKKHKKSHTAEKTHKKGAMKHCKTCNC